MEIFSIKYDDEGDVLYIRKGNPRTYKSSKEDPRIVIRRNDAEEIVGLTIISASELQYDYWRSEHPVRKYIPIELAKSVDTWISSKVDGKK